jgi:hypothetical protein
VTAGSTTEIRHDSIVRRTIPARIRSVGGRQPNSGTIRPFLERVLPDSGGRPVTADAELSSWR